MFHDTKELYGHKLPRKVESTKWNDRCGLTGRDPFDFNFHEELYGSKNGHALRLMANGWFFRLEVCKSIDEREFCKALLAELRKPDCQVELGQAVRAVARENDLDHTSKKDKSNAWAKVGQHLVETMQSTVGSGSKSGTDTTMKELSNISRNSTKKTRGYVQGGPLAQHRQLMQRHRPRQTPPEMINRGSSRNS